MDVAKYVRNAAQHRVSLGFPGILWKAPKVSKPSFDWGEYERVSFTVSGEGSGLETGALYLVCEGTDGQRATYGPMRIGDREEEFGFQIREPRAIQSVRFEWRGAGPVRVEVGPIKLVCHNRQRVFDDFTHEQWWLSRGPEADVKATSGNLLLSVPAQREAEKPYQRWPGAERSAAFSAADTDWQIDFTEFDAAVEKYYPWAANVIWLPLPSVPRGVSVEEALKLIAESGLPQIAAAAEKHLREKGWLDAAYTYLWDEPQAEEYAVVDLLTKTVKEAAPGLRNMMTARGFPPALPNVDIWCPEIYSFDPEGAERERAKGKTLWWYVAFSCRHPYPNFWIDYPALDCRVVPWLTWKHKIQGFLYWSISNWYAVDDPLKEQTFPGANGDGTLIYPGPDGGPIDTIRWENIREGLEDYEYFVLLQRAAGGASEGRVSDQVLRRAKELLAIDESLVKDYANWSSDPQAYMAARREMARIIEKLSRA
jgi:hypothetical protein